MEPRLAQWSRIVAVDTVQYNYIFIYYIPTSNVAPICQYSKVKLNLIIHLSRFKCPETDCKTFLVGNIFDGTFPMSGTQEKAYSISNNWHIIC